MKISFKLIAVIIALYTSFSISSAIGQQTDACLLTNGQINSQVSASLPSLSIKTGLDFNLTLSLPGLTGCEDYTVSIKATDNLVKTNGYDPYAFTSTGPNTNIYNATIPSIEGLNFGVPFKFKPGQTCDGEEGILKISIKIRCGDVIKQCVLVVAIKAEAKNTWSVKKEHIWGNLSGGSILWRITLVNSDPSGYGTYNISDGSISDAISSGTITSVSGTTSQVINSGTEATWSTGPISNTTAQVQYNVYSTSCEPTGTIIENCVKYKLKIGKSECLIDLKEKTCANVTLSNTVSVNPNFSKSLTYGNSLNYAQGCEGEYTIQISNAGNVPLTALQLYDAIPSGITITAISITSTGANMNYTTTSPASTGNTGSSQSFTNLSLMNPSTFTFNTNSGALIGETITIKMRFTITASQGTIDNCAKLSYIGTYDEWGNICNTPLPQLPSSNSLLKCASFTVQESKAIPGLSKCITSGIQTYNVGDEISFRIVVSNHGQGNLNGYTILDQLTNTLQLLEISSPISYGFGIGAFSPNYPSCAPLPMNSGKPSWLTEFNVEIGSQNPSWSIDGMQGECTLDKAYYLVIEFKAKIRPTMYGNYVNTVKLSGDSILTSSAPYNINRIGKLDIEKYVNSGSGSPFGTVGYVNPGQAFAYKLVVTNTGSVEVKNIDINDILPSCVTQTGIPTANINRADGTINMVTITSAPNLNISPSVTLKPGDTLSIIINVTRNANDNTPECCNDAATVTSLAIDNLMNVNSISDKACIKSSLCCNIQNMNVSYNTYINGNSINPVFVITSNSIPIQQIDISLIDYHVNYENENCKPINIGNYVGHIQPFVGNESGNFYDFSNIPFTGSPALTQSNTITQSNNSITWSGTTPINLFNGSSFNGFIVLNFITPNVINLDGCSGKVYFCFKVSVKDAQCNVCEKIVCGSAELPKKKKALWKDEKQRAVYELEELKNIKTKGSVSLKEFLNRMKK